MKTKRFGVDSRRRTNFGFEVSWEIKAERYDIWASIKRWHRTLTVEFMKSLKRCLHSYFPADLKFTDSDGTFTSGEYLVLKLDCISLYKLSSLMDDSHYFKSEPSKVTTRNEANDLRFFFSFTSIELHANAAMCLWLLQNALNKILILDMTIFPCYG